MTFSEGDISSEFDSSLFHFLCQFAFYFAAATVFRMFQVPGDPLIHTGILWHLMRGMPFLVKLWFHSC